MSLFDKLFGHHIRGPRSEEVAATESIWPSDIKLALQKITGLPQEKVDEIYHILFDPREGMISVAVASNVDVKLTGLGKFTLRERTSGDVRLASGKIVHVPSRNYPKFVTSQVWKEQVR